MSPHPQPNTISLTIGMEEVVPGLIWKVCTHRPLDIAAMHPALCDWNTVAIEEIHRTKAITSRVVFGQPTNGFTSSRDGIDFIQLNRGQEHIYIVANNNSHSSVGVYYGVTPEEFTMQVGGASLDWDLFCYFLTYQSQQYSSM